MSTPLNSFAFLNGMNYLNLRTKKVARYVNGLKGSLQEKIGLQTVWTVAEASSLALKAELQEKSPRIFSFNRKYSNSSTIETATEKNLVNKDPYLNPGTKGATSSKATNPYLKPSGDKCFCCGGQGHRSNVCPSRKTAAVMHEETEDEEEEDEFDGDESAEEETEESLNFVVQKVLWSPKEEEAERRNLFRTDSSIQNKLCNLIVDNGS